MRSPVLRLLAPALILAVVATVMSVSPASAALTRGDGRDAAAPIDTRRVVRYPNLRREVVVELSSPTYRVGRDFNGLHIRYDTARDAVGDYRLIWGLAKDGDGFTPFRLYRAGGNQLVRPVRCLDARAPAAIAAGDRSWSGWSCRVVA